MLFNICLIEASVFYKDMFNLKLSQGTIGNIIQKVNERASHALDFIKQHISTSKVVGFDELDTIQAWSEKLGELIRSAINQRNENPNLIIT